MGGYLLPTGHLHIGIVDWSGRDVHYAAGLPHPSCGVRGSSDDRWFESCTYVCTNLPSTSASLDRFSRGVHSVVQLESIPRTTRLPAFADNADGTCSAHPVRGCSCRAEVERADGRDHSLCSACTRGIYARPETCRLWTHRWRTQILK